MDYFLFFGFFPTSLVLKFRSGTGRGQERYFKACNKVFTHNLIPHGKHARYKPVPVKL